MNIYYRVLANVVFLVVSLGFAIPWLISASDSMLVAGGFAYICAIPVVLYYGNVAFVKQLFSNKE